MKTGWDEKDIEYIIGEIQNLKGRLKPIFKDEPEVIARYWEKLARYLLGEDNNVLDELSMEEINQVLSDLLTSLRYPASAPPLNIPTPRVDIKEVFDGPERLFVTVDNYFDQFNGSPAVSILGRLFSLFQKELLQHFRDSEKQTALCTPIDIGGNKIGLLVYFPDAKIEMNQTGGFDPFRPFKSHNMSDNACDYYRFFYGSSFPGAVLLFYYSAENNCYFLTSGKGFLPLSCFTKKQEVRQLRDTIMKGHAGSRPDRAPAAAVLSRFDSKEKKELLYMVLRMAQYCCLESFETKKNYANSHIRDKIGRLEGDAVPYHHVFESLSWFLPFSAAVMWGRDKNRQWVMRERQLYTRHDYDSRECRLQTGKGPDIPADFAEQYAGLLQGSLPADGLDLTTIFDNQKPVLMDVENDKQKQLSALFGYSDKSWNWSLDCKSRFVIPVNDPDVPATILDVYFHEDAEWMKLFINDNARMIARLYAILKDEVNYRLLQSNQLRHIYIGKLAHEINNWFPQVNRRLEDLQHIIDAGRPADQDGRARENIGLARVRLRYFSDIFEIVLSEVRNEKHMFRNQTSDPEEISKKYSLRKQTVYLDKIMTRVKETVIDLCVHDINYRYRPITALGLLDDEKGRETFKKLLEERILVKQTGMNIHENETLIFTCFQEMLKNAISKHDWSSNDNFIMQARAVDETQVGLRVTNTPRREERYLQGLVDYSRSLVADESLEHEGFGNLWLKTIQRLLHGKFTVPPDWLNPNAATYPTEFWLEIIIPAKVKEE